MAELVIRPDAIRDNAAAVRALLARRTLLGERREAPRLIGVTKVCLGDPTVARAMLEGGAAALADSREPSLARLRAALPGVELHRIHLTAGDAQRELADVFYVSSPAGLEGLDGRGGRAEVMALVETGDQREGAPLEELHDLARKIALGPGTRLRGVATNFACFAGRPEHAQASVEMLAAAARGLEAGGVAVPEVSGGNSSLLGLLMDGVGLPLEVTEIRCGEALLLGQETLRFRALPGGRQDGCRLRAEVLERYTKSFFEVGSQRVVLGLGSQGLGNAPVRFLRPEMSEVGRSSDYLVAEVAAGAQAPEIGAVVEMIPSYHALVAAWTSPFVEVRFE
ncbi:MAG TPA: alanine racemase [Thermoleophilia bacterium]|nr:alanine racemase [Thermoleophilia bacterium]